MGASCAVKGSKSHPCHCCSHLASPGASVQQQQHHHHRHHHHHHETHHAHHQHHHHHHPAGKQPSAELQPQNNNGDCNILAPLRSKMKVLKKLKRKMGLVIDFYKILGPFKRVPEFRKSPLYYARLLFPFFPVIHFK